MQLKNSDEKIPPFMKATMYALLVCVTVRPKAKSYSFYIPQFMAANTRSTDTKLRNFQKRDQK
jgi:hypothetical protein